MLPVPQFSSAQPWSYNNHENVYQGESHEGGKLHSGYKENLQNNVQKRLERLIQAGRFDIHTKLIQVSAFLNSNPALREILVQLESKHKLLAATALEVVAENRAKYFDTEAEQVGFSFHIVRECVRAPNTRSIEVDIGKNLCWRRK